MRYNAFVAPVAQLDRVLGYEPRGRGFESCRARHKIKGLQKCKPFLFVRANTGLTLVGEKKPTKDVGQ